MAGGALISAFVEVVFDRLASPRVLDLIRGRKLNGTLLSKLKVMLLSIDAVADDAESMQLRDTRVRSWLFEVKDAVVDAEDILDEIHCEALKYELEAESETTTTKVWNFFNNTYFNREIDLRLKQVLDKLEYLASQKGFLGLRDSSLVWSDRQVPFEVPSSSLLTESVIYGRNDEKEIILNWLMSDVDNRNQLSILSIVGMGGMGKTTLAQHIYYDPRLEEATFDIKAWVCVSEDFDVLKVTEAILEAITRWRNDSKSLEMICAKLKKKLTGKRFLLVLDDVWNEDGMKWEAVRTTLNCGAKGSIIIVTTRSEKVASVMLSNQVHHLEQLHEEHCWQIFAKHAFPDNEHQLNADLKNIGIMIVEKCKGLPLALSTIGRLLYTKSSLPEWETVLTSKIWDFPEENRIAPALFISYYYLPSHLKVCFAYCALFPKDFEFVKQGLILLWMAENFLQCHQQSKSPEEVGEQYFDYLLSMSFFQQSIRDKECFVMHDLLNELANYVSGCGDSFKLGVDDEKSIPRMTRHFSLAINHIQYFNGFGSLYDAKRLRTFLPTSTGFNFGDPWLCKMSMHELFSKFKFLHVLSLSWCCSLTEVPHALGYLKHLRSLDLSNTGIKLLPDSTCLLYNLQILKLSYCINLEELPSNLHKLVNLRYLEFVGTKLRKVPMQLGELQNLQISGSFYVGKSSEFGIQQLRELNLCGELSIGELQNVVNPSDALAVDLKNKTQLVELKLEWNRNRNWNQNQNQNQNQSPDDSWKEKKVFENLQPSKHLRKLSIINYGGTQFPHWLFDNSLANVVFLRLDNCKYCLCLPPLGLLPSLKHLTITGLDGILGIYAYFYGSNSSPFKSLETLEFSNMKEWKEWECEDIVGAFPCLQSLSMKHCPKLKGHLPKQIPHLKKLIIQDCKQLVALAPHALEICDLELQDCGELQFDYHPTTLERLIVSGHYMKSSMLETIGHIICHTSLEFLHIDSCPHLNIPMIRCYNLLDKLEISGGCDSLTIFPLDLFPKLCQLELKCPNLQLISQSCAHNHLKDLKISGCHQFALPEHMHTLLPSLDSLHIEDCQKVDVFPDGGLPSNLTRIDLSNCYKHIGGWPMNLPNCYKLIASLKGALGSNTSLKTLSIGKLYVKSFPDEGLLPLSLKVLRIRNCWWLEKLDYKGLCQLSSLEELILDDCPNLQCLPEEGMPRSISTLRILSCSSLLKQCFLEPEGAYWGKIAHIENIWVDGKPIR